MNGIDCATQLTQSLAQALKNAGIQAVGRYLGGDYALKDDEAQVIHGAGLSLFLIYERKPTQVEYFTYNQGLTDALEALREAESLEVPAGVCIYFTVDYDAQEADFQRIEGYVEGLLKGIEGKYLVGMYGSYYLFEYLGKSVYRPQRYFQTSAWSKGNMFPGNSIYQRQDDTALAGIVVDLDDVNENAGMW